MKTILESCVELLRSTLGSMNSSDADKVVLSVANILEAHAK